MTCNVKVREDIGKLGGYAHPGTFLGRVNDLHTWQFPAGRPADRLTGWPTGLDKIKSSDWLKVGMLYRRGGH